MSEQIQVFIGGENVSVTVDGGNVSAGADLNLAELQQAVQDAETAAGEAAQSAAEAATAGATAGAAAGASAGSTSGAAAGSAAGATAGDAAAQAVVSLTTLTRSQAILSNIPPIFNTIITTGYSVSGDGGDALYRRASSEPTHNGKFQSADGAWWEITGGEVDIRAFGAKADGVTQNQQAIEDAQVYLSARGGGVLLYPPGTILVGLLKTTNDSGPQHLAIDLRPRVLHKGSGKYTTTVKLANGQNCHVFYGFNRDDVAVEDLGVDGNRDNQAVQNPSTGNDPAGIILINTIRNARLEHLYIRNTCDYGIGFEGDMAAIGCIVNDVHFKNTGADGFDSKGLGGSYGNFITNIYVEGLNPSIGQASYQAGVNPREGWTVSNVTVDDLYGDQCGVRLNGDDSGLAIYGPVSNVVARARDGELGTFAVMADSHGTTFSNIYSDRAGTTVLVRGRENSFVNIFGINASHVVRINARTSGPAPERNLFTNVTSRNARGFPIYIEHATAGGNKFQNLTMRSGTGGGIRVAAGATRNTFTGGEYTSSTGTALQDSGSNTVIRGIFGMTTEVSGQTSPVATDSTGVKTVTFAHGLIATPEVKDIQISLSGVSGNTVELGNFYVVNSNATDITIASNVVTAAPGGSSVRFNVSAGVKRG